MDRQPFQRFAIRADWTHQDFLAIPRQFLGITDISIQQLILTKQGVFVAGLEIE
jgi:hypothetical protein